MTELQNREIAESLMYYDKTIALLACGAAEHHVAALSKLLRDAGWYVYTISEENFKNLRGQSIAGITVVCDAATLSWDMEESLERYLHENGRLFIIGGPLFGNTEITKPAMTLEGVSPLFKTFREENCGGFETLPQCITDAQLTGDAPYVICPNARADGAGFGMNRRNRMLSLVSVKKDGGRDDGRRGSAAFFMLSDSIGHMVCTPGTRLGNVSPITQGCEAAVIGMPLSSLLKMGGEGLIVDMMRALDRGVFLFEAGAEGYTAKPGAAIPVGAKILSAARDFTDVTVRFTLNGASLELSELAAGQNYTTLRGILDGVPEGDYTLRTELIVDGEVIDRVDSQLFVTNGIHSSNPDDFVQVEDGDFKLGGKTWHMLGINYFPLYQVSFELNDYWRGAFDKSNYIPSEVEKDLAYIKKLGMNSVAIRIECTAFENFIEPLRDFFCRCARHGLKIMLSFCNITNPLFFDERAFAVFMEKMGIADDPILFAHDIFWESGANFYPQQHTRRFAEDWRRWLVDQYGSFEAAEESFGQPLDRTAAGEIINPPVSILQKHDKSAHPKMAAYTRFLFDMVSRRWNDAITAMKQYDSRHLYTNRMGVTNDDIPNVFLSGAAKHFDFMCLEAYSFTLDEAGYLASAAADRAAHYVSGGKPTAWVEYGISLPGMSGFAYGMKLLWDGERNRGLDWRLEEQREYQAQFNRMFHFCDVKGSMPWFWPGGFRFTEHSD
ncbi:MAG: hypothetical protein E7632_12895, partial [Ruminococcaceae bacterium]|nr:hypothetical protein [Oscillospiraceae bacterium]